MDVWGQTTLEWAGFPTVLDLVSSRDVQNEATLLNSGCQRTPDLQIRTNVFLIGPDRYGQPASGLYRPPARSFPSPPTRTAVSTPTCPAFKDTLRMMERGSTRRRYLTAGKRIESPGLSEACSQVGYVLNIPYLSEVRFLCFFVFLFDQTNGILLMFFCFQFFPFLVELRSCRCLLTSSCTVAERDVFRNMSF